MGHVVWKISSKVNRSEREDRGRSKSSLVIFS